MKKSLSFLVVAVLLLGVFPSFACADVLDPVSAIAETAAAYPLIAIAAAVLIIAFILWRIFRKTDHR